MKPKKTIIINKKKLDPGSSPWRKVLTKNKRIHNQGSQFYEAGIKHINELSKTHSQEYSGETDITTTTKNIQSSNANGS